MLKIPPWLRTSLATRKIANRPHRGIELDLGAWPTIVARFFDFSTDEIEPHIDALLALLQEGPCGIIYDLRAARRLRPDEYGYFAQTFRLQGELLQSACRGGAVLTDSSAMRGIVAAVNWIAPAPFPLRIFKEELAASAWLDQCFRGGSSSPPNRAVG